MVPIGDKLEKPPRNAKELMATGLLEGHYVHCSCRGEQVSQFYQMIRQYCRHEQHHLQYFQILFFMRSFTFVCVLPFIPSQDAQPPLGCRYSLESSYYFESFGAEKYPTCKYFRIDFVGL